MSVSNISGLPKEDIDYVSGKNSLTEACSKDSRMTLRSNAKITQKSSDTSAINVVSFNGDLSERLKSIGLAVKGVRNFTIGDIEELDLDSEDDEDYAPFSNRESLKSDASSGVSSKTKVIIGTIAAVAAIAFGFYVGSRYFSDNAGELECLAEKLKSENACSKTIETLTKSVQSTYQEGYKAAETAADIAAKTLKAQAYQEGYKAAENDGDIICKRILTTMDSKLTCTRLKDNKPVVTQLQAIYSFFRNAVLGDIAAATKKTA